MFHCFHTETPKARKLYIEKKKKEKNFSILVYCLFQML